MNEYRYAEPVTHSPSTAPHPKTSYKLARTATNAARLIGKCTDLKLNGAPAG